MVPKIIHHIVGPKSNELTRKCMGSWKNISSYGFTFKIWDDPMLEKFIRETYPFALDAFLNARNHAEAADIARYLIVHAYGGHYFDWDVQLISIPEFLAILEDYPSGYLVQDPFNSTLASEAFSAEKGEQFLLSLTEDIVKIYNNGFRDSMSTPKYSGPFRMRDSYYLGCCRSQQKLIPVKNIFLYDYSEIRDMPARDKKTAMIHYWMHSWFSQQDRKKIII